MASGDILHRFSWDANQLDASAPSLPDWRTNGRGVQSLAVSDFSIVGDIFDSKYSGGGVTVDHYLLCESAAANDTKIEGSWERTDLNGLDADSDSFATAVSSGDVTVPGTAGKLFKVSIAFTDGAQMDSLAVNEPFRYRIQRKAAASDISGRLQWMHIVIKET